MLGSLNYIIIKIKSGCCYSYKTLSVIRNLIIKMSKYPNQNVPTANSTLSSPPGCSTHSLGSTNNQNVSSSLSRASSTGSLYAQVGEYNS